MTPRAEPASENLEPRSPSLFVAIVQITALVAAAGLVVFSRGWDDWNLPRLAVITVFTIVSELAAVRVGSGKLRVSGSGLGLLLAAVLLGGGPAAIVGVISIAVGWLGSRESGPWLRQNLATFAWCPLITGLLFVGVLRFVGVHGHPIGYYLLVFVAYFVALSTNLLGVLGFDCYLKRGDLIRKLREVVGPLLSAQLFSALLSMAAVWLTVKLGTTGLLLLGLMFVIFQYLISELLTSKRRSEDLQRIASTDELTGLANRERFRERVEERIVEAERTGRGFAVMLMDLDRFKEINDTLGHHYGDVLLRDLGPRLVDEIGPSGLVARLGGDEFGLLPPAQTRGQAKLEQLVGRLVGRVSEPFSVDELSLEVGASIGISRYPEDGTDSHALLRCADIAMYAAKEGQTDYKIYTVEQNQHSVRRLSVLGDFRHALANDEILVHYQPIIELEEFGVRAAEALVRWQHPELGLVSPAGFVSTIEQTGLIGPLTRRVLEHAIAECARWRQDGHELSVAVNLSVRNLLDRDLPKEIEQMLAVHSLPADALQLEITESMIMSDPDRAVATVSRLSALGVQLSVDDFGTGYSSLANLRKLPIDELKIDRSFVSPMLHTDSDLIIVRSTINLGHDLGLRVIAEGVEDHATLERLAALGCDQAQGYHISRPIPGPEFRAWLANPFAAPDDTNGGYPPQVADPLVDVAPAADALSTPLAAGSEI